MARQSRLLSLLGIERGEGQLVLLVFGFAVLHFITNTLIRTASYALFLATFDAQTLPYAYIGVSVFATLASSVYLKLSSRFSLTGMPIGVLCLKLLTFAGYRIGLDFAEPGWLTFTLPIYFGVVNTLDIIIFWNLLGRLFNLQQGKRLFGLLTSAEHIATIAVGFLTPLLVGLAGTLNLFLVAAAALGGSLSLLIVIARRYRQLLSVPAEDSAGEAQAREGGLLRNRYILLIFAMFTVFILGIYFVDNIFYAQVEARYPDENQLASFISVFFGVVGVVSLVMQLFVSGRLLSRFGLRAVLLITPVALSACAVLFALLGTFSGPAAALFWIAVTASLLRLVLDATDSAAVNLLYQPLPPLQRTRAQTIVDGILYPVGIGLAGGTLLLLTNGLGLDVVQLAYVQIFILAAWTALAVLLGREYPRRLREALSRRSLGSVAELRPDRSSIAVLRQSLDSPQPGAVIYALDVLEAVAPEELPGSLPALLEHRAPEVRLDVLRRAERLGLASLAPAIGRRVHLEGSGEVRGESLRALATLGDAAALEAVYPALEASDRQVQLGAMVGLLRSGEIEAMLAAGERLLGWASSPDPQARVLAARALGESHIRTLHRPLARLLREEHPAVRRAALDAAAKLQHPNLWPLVIECLAVPASRAAAGEALVAGGAAALPALEAAFARYEREPAVLMRLAQIAGRIGGPAAVRLLRARIAFPEARVRGQVLRALNRCAYQADDHAPIVEQIRAEAAQAAWTLAAIADLADDAALDEPGGRELALVISALEHALDRHRANMFLWLSFLLDPQLVREMQRSLLGTAGGSAAGAGRAYAQEIIEVQLAPRVRALVRPLVDDLPPAEALRRLSALFPQTRASAVQRLREIIGGAPAWFTPWLQMCALAAGAALRAVELRPAVAALIAAPEPLVSETASYALARLDGAQAVRIGQGDGAMLTPVEKVIRLKAVPFFAGVPEELLAEIAATLEEREVKAGQTIVERESLDDSLYIIVSGQARAWHGPHGALMLGENDVFGELGVLDPSPSPASVDAVEDTRLLRLGQEAFRELVDEHREVAWGIMQLLARRVRWLQQAPSGRGAGDLLGEIQDRLRSI